MSRQYDKYLIEHRENVYKGYLWILANIGKEELDDILPEIRYSDMMVQMKLHDGSKDTLDEYDAYDRYFYGNGGYDAEVKKEFNLAWLKHIHRNPHHWQYWVLIHDDPDEGKQIEPLDMPDNYILEMICDWWSFSWRKRDEEVEDAGVGSDPNQEALNEIFDWYNEYKDGILLSNETRRKVEQLLDVISKKLDEIEDAEEVDFGDEEERDIDDPIGGTVIVGEGEE